MSQSRRTFLKYSLAAASGSLLHMPFVHGTAQRKVVIVGGGIGGATAAKYLKIMDPSIDVTLIEPKASYITCFMTKRVIYFFEIIQIQKQYS